MGLLCLLIIPSFARFGYFAALTVLRFPPSLDPAVDFKPIDRRAYTFAAFAAVS